MFVSHVGSYASEADIIDNSVHGAAVVTPFTPSGFVATTTFTDYQCTRAIAGDGYAANTCYVDEGFAFMIRLVKGMSVPRFLSPPGPTTLTLLSTLETDSCVGGLVEYYSDRNCTRHAGVGALTKVASAVCRGDGFGTFRATTCTSRPDPLVFADSSVTRYNPPCLTVMPLVMHTD